MERVKHRHEFFPYSQARRIRILLYMLLAVFFLLFVHQAKPQNKNTIASVRDGMWSDGTTWDLTIPGSANQVYILEGHTVTLNTNADVGSITIMPGATLMVAGDYRLTIAPGGAFVNQGTFYADTGAVVMNTASSTKGSILTEFYNMEVVGIDVVLDNATTMINGVFELKSGSVSEAPVFRENSTLRYSQGANQTRGVEWNHPYHVQVSGNTKLDLNGSDFGADLTIQGNLSIDAGSSVYMGIRNHYYLIVRRDVFINGDLLLTDGDMQLGGNWQKATSPTGIFEPNHRKVIFNGILPQRYSGHTVFNDVLLGSGSRLILEDNITINGYGSETTATMEIEADAVLDAGIQVVDGDGTFILNNDATLMIGHPEGIETMASTGNIQTAQRIFGEAAIYHFTGSGNQKSGNAVPAESSPKVIIIELENNEEEFTFSTSAGIEIGIGGRLEIRSGTLLEAADFSDGRHVEGAGDLVMTGGNYLFKRIVSEGSDIYCPRLKGIYSNGQGSNMEGKIVLAGTSGYQHLNAGKLYNDILFTGSGIKTIPNRTSDVKGTVTIEIEAVVDASNHEFGNEFTNLTMTGGRFITSRAEPSPEMEGEYLLSGGTIEFANDNITNQTIRGGLGIVYYNIDVTGRNVSNSSGRIQIAPGGIFTIKEDGLFRIASTMFISGEGSFVMEKHSTFLYGSPDGINLEGITSSDGNIRVEGDRVFPSLATYGFTGGMNQISGNALPPSVHGLIVNKTDSHTVTLSNDLIINGELVLINGILITEDKDLYLSNHAAGAIIADEENDLFSKSYIIGTLKRQIATTGEDYHFPVGYIKGAKPATVNFSDGQLPGTEIKTLTAMFDTMPEKYYGNLPQLFDGVIVNTLSQEGCWRIEAENISSSVFTLTLFAHQEGNIQQPEGIRILKRNQGETEWFMAGDSPTHQVVGSSYGFTQYNVAGFSEFALGGNFDYNPLPLEWLSFEALSVNSQVELSWQTASETNNDYFSVLRSATGLDYQELGYISGTGNSIRCQSYSFTDEKPLAGINYYRICQTDYDGMKSYSKTVAVEVECLFNIEVFCHNHKLHFQLPEQNGSWMYRIYSISGVLLISGTFSVPRDQHLVLDAVRWRNQLLVISLTSGKESFKKKVFIK